MTAGAGAALAERLDGLRESVPDLKLVVLLERSAGVFREFQSLVSRRYADRPRLREAQRRAIQVFLHQEGLT
jgi:hypothetical protein